VESPLTLSPCVRNCCLDDDDVCLGCGRSLEEIIAWSTSPEERKTEILRLCRERLELKERRRGGVA
jgi:predicted Fe-S protein YdhL (DUF1289 family)